MMMKTLPARWKVRTETTPADAELARRCEISPVTATVLRVRGHETPDAVWRFLHPDASTQHDPFLLPDAEAAVARLHRAITAREPLLIHGDYDVDGVTSTALLMRALGSLGANVSHHIPERRDGYGLSVLTVEAAAERGIKLLLTADCGVRDVEAVARANELGMDVIITDHHEPAPDGSLPDAVAVVNPKRLDSQYPFAELSGCGVAFKLLAALMQRHWPKYAASFQEKFIDLAALAVIADCVPLLDENRYIAREGLRLLASTRKAGLSALKRSAGLRDDLETLRSSDVGFRLGPRLNAAGRLGSPQVALQLMLSADAAECAQLAQQMEEYNAARRDIEKRITDEAHAMVMNGDIDLATDMAIVLAGENWNSGVLGLVAGRLAERFHRPAIVLNRSEGVAKGSGRTAAGFNLHKTIEATRELLLHGGGHEAACGMALDESRFDEFRARVLECAALDLKADDLVPIVEADCAVTGRDLTIQLARDLEKLEPCGQGNAEAQLLLRGAKIVDGKCMGAKGEHVKWFIEADGARHEAIWWRPGERAANMVAGTTVEMCCVPELNHWNGNTRLQLIIKDARPLR